MFTMRRNQRGFYYANYEGETDVISAETNMPNGEKKRTFTDAVFAWGNISPDSGRLAVEPYGFNLAYDLAIYPATDAGEIREGARLWINTTPDSGGHNYEVVRAGISLNETVIAAKRVTSRA